MRNMLASTSPLPPPSAGSAANLSSADPLGAHGRLAAIDPGDGEDTLLSSILGALLLGSGSPCGLLARPGGLHEIVASGLPLDGPLAGHLREALVSGRAAPEALAPVLAEAFAGAFEAVDPRTIPLSVDDETLAYLLLPKPPVDPAGFASVVAHAASLLSRHQMALLVQRADFELKSRVWELESLYQVGLSIAGTLDWESLADDILMNSVSLLNAAKGALLVKDIAGEGQILLKDFGGHLLPAATDIDLPGDLYVSNSLEDRIESLRGANAEKLLAVPISSDGQRLGILIVADKENRAGGVDDFHPETDGRILMLFGNQAAIALENARLHKEALEKERIEREIELAATIQKTILPDTLPEVPGLILAGGNQPTRQVGGDYFDVFPLPDGKTAFCVADVAGKGVPAALLVSTVHACLHLLLPALSDDLVALSVQLNRHLVRYSSTRKFATLLLAVFDPKTRELRYVNAGHNPGILLSGGEVTLLPAGGPPVGMLALAVHREARIVLQEGDLLVLYSDGITEAQDAQDEEFGMEKLTCLIETHAAESPAELTARIFRDVADFTRGVAQYDDQTVLVARVKSGSENG
ncbi:MAG: SpoIIE family protein phosphatase [Acidobacteria bacterium]|nr:SpoIIE family protein phosphatase [Acidobacteriota bacterium]